MAISINNLLLQDLYAERSDAMLIELGVAHSIRVPQSTDLVAHFVLEGTIVITVDTMDSPVTLNRGEYALLFYGNQHCISLGRKQPANEYVINEWPVSDEPPILQIGSQCSAKFISAALRLVRSPVTTRAQQPLPPLVALKHEAQPLFKNTTLVDNTAHIDSCCRGAGSGAFINTFLNLHLVQAIRGIYDQAKHNLDVHIGEQHWRSVAAAVRMLRTHPEKPWTVATLAQELGISRSCFAAKFRTDVGVGPIEFLNNIRMEKAAELLQEHNDLLLSVISRQVGYDSASSFARAFKAHFGVSPRGYVEQQTRSPTKQNHDPARVWNH